MQDGQNNFILPINMNFDKITTMDYRRVFIENSYVFLTIVTSKRRKILVKNIEIIKNAIYKVIKKYNCELFAICILPDHLHLIIKPYEISDYPIIVSQIKMNFSRNIDIKSIENYSLSKSKNSKRELDVWQRRYWEHTILSENDLYKHLDYIHYNPMKHYNIAPKDWRYSSFKKFVKLKYYEETWCNFEDKHCINSMNCE